MVEYKIKKYLVKVFNKAISALGVKLVRSRSNSLNNFNDIFVKDRLSNWIVNLNNLSALSQNIRGMIDERTGEELFALTYMQALSGDVAEIGSFQGKSTFFLGNAVKLSGNGKLYAIDHFRGNLGKENFYVVGKSDLSDLESGFISNIKKAQLEDSVTLINKPNDEAVSEIEDSSLRLLYIDGDHTEDGVYKDLQLFKKKLKSSAIIIFDDYDNVGFPGVVKVVNNFCESFKIRRKYLIERTLVIELAP